MFAVPAYMRSKHDTYIWGDKRGSNFSVHGEKESILSGLSAGIFCGLFAYTYPGFAAVLGSGFILGPLGSYFGAKTFPEKNEKYNK
jgi:hypothetical protein